MSPCKPGVQATGVPVLGGGPHNPGRELPPAADLTAQGATLALAELIVPHWIQFGVISSAECSGRSCKGALAH